MPWRTARAKLAAILLAAGGCMPTGQADAVAPSTLVIRDEARARDVPVALYGAEAAPKPLAVISNGYGGVNTAYGHLAEALTARGFVAASIQHDLPGDPPLPREGGDLAMLRRPFWEAAAGTILVVRDELRRRGLAADAPLVLVGHSNGGDISMLLAAERPEEVRLAFSLDNRRMPLPRTSKPRICSLRSSDQSADPGVLPTADEAARLGMQITQAPDLRHDDMWAGARPDQRRLMVDALLRCLDGA